MEVVECLQQVDENYKISMYDSRFEGTKSPIEKVSYKIGGKYCFARWCNNSRRTKPDVTLFRLPVKEKERAFQWLTNASRDDLVGKSLKYLHALRLCHEHFTDEMFMNVSKKRLNRMAVPELFTKPDIVRQLDERRVKKKPDEGVAETLQLQDGQHRLILPKTDSSSSGPVMLVKTPVLKTAQCWGHTVKNSCPRLNILGHLEVVPESELSQRDSSANAYTFSDTNNPPVLQKLVDMDVESLSSYFVDKDQTFSETESVCTDHSFQKWADTIYPCPSCGEMFLVKSNLIRHQTTFHSERLVQCETCGNVVLSKSEFLEHVCSGNHTYEDE